MAKRIYLMRLLLALLFFALLFSISLMFSSFRISSSHFIDKTIVGNSSLSRLDKGKANGSAEANVNNYDFWTKYYNDNRLGRSWDFNIFQKYAASELHKYRAAVVEQMYAERPGEMGSGPTLPPEKARLQLELNKKYNFNFSLSIQTSYPDVRYPQCKNLSYMSALPAASIIITFHTEPATMLVRNIWRLINKTPSDLLREIILVDDSSDKPMDDYLKLLPPKVVRIRTDKREGLTRARTVGARHAKGNVLIFLDPHADCLEGWLEPILNRIANDRSVIAVPLVDDVNLGHVELIQMQRHEHQYGWDWNLTIKTWPPTEADMKRRHGDKTVPYRTVTMLGSAFAVDREFFFEIGAYDDGMDIWGSDHMELSLRVWLCGGAIEIVPCSHTLNLFRTWTSPSDGDKEQKIKIRNNVRVAEIYMDEFKEFFYMRSPAARNLNVGDLSERKEFVQKLKCRKFRWMLDNVFTQSVMGSNYVNMGQIRTAEKADPRCFDSYSGGHKRQLKTLKCNYTSSETQGFVYFKTKQLAFAETQCVGVDKLLSSQNQTLARPIFVECDAKDGNQKWELDEKGGKMRIKHSKTGLCMHHLDPFVVARACDASKTQLWKWNSTLPINLERPVEPKMVAPHVQVHVHKDQPEPEPDYSD